MSPRSVLRRSVLVATCLIGIGPMLVERSYSAGEIVVADSSAIDSGEERLEDVLYAPAPLLAAGMKFQVQVAEQASDLCVEFAGSFELGESYRSETGDECYWRLDLVRPSAETCPSAEQPSGTNSCYAIPTLYFFASSSAGWITSVRYRLNAMSAPAGSGLKILRRIAETAFKARGWSMPEGAAGDIDSGTKATWTAGGVEYVFLRDDGDTPRFDLLVRFPPASALDYDEQVMRRCGADDCNYVLRYP